MKNHKTLFLGDIHCNYIQMEDYIVEIQKEFNDGNEFDRIIQVGDFGYYSNFVGDDKIFNYRFGLTRGFSYAQLPSYDLSKEMIFIRGNHEDHKDLSSINHGQELKDTYLGQWKFAPDGLLKDGILYVGGAWSIDGQARQEAAQAASYALPFLDEWQEKEEEVSVKKAEEILEFAADHRKDIEILITHDCDHDLLFSILSSKIQQTRTGTLIKRLLEDCIEPEYHFFGHHHTQGSFPRHRNGVTRQILLNNIESVRVWQDPNLVDIYHSIDKFDPDAENPEKIIWNGWFYIL